VVGPSRALDATYGRNRKAVLLPRARFGTADRQRRARLLAEATVGAFFIAVDRWLTSENEVSIDALTLYALAALHVDLDGIEAVQRPVAQWGRPDEPGASG
jgi:hypothetical protein